MTNDRSITDRIGAELHVGDQVLLRATVIDVHPDEEDLDIRVEIVGRRFPHVALCGRDCRLACREIDRGDAHALAATSIEQMRLGPRDFAGILRAAGESH